MIEFFKNIVIKSLTPSKDNGNYLTLDKNMKKQMKLAGVISILIFIILVIVTIYFYLKTPFIVDIANKTKNIIIDEINDSGDLIPEWIKTIFLISIFVIISLTTIFFYFLIDLSKLHYRLDNITFKVIKGLNLSLYEKTVNILSCGNRHSCVIQNKLLDKEYQRRFRNEFFYFFTNKDEIGAFNQRDKRRQVFTEWTRYYIFNFVFIFLILVTFWVGYLVIIINPINLGWKIPIYLASLILLFLWYKKIGKKYRTILIALAIDQLNIIFSEVRLEAIRKLKDIFGNCFETGCNINN